MRRSTAARRRRRSRGDRDRARRLAREGPDVGHEVPAAGRHRVDEGRSGPRGSSAIPTEPGLAAASRPSARGDAHRGRGARRAAQRSSTSRPTHAARARDLRALRRRVPRALRGEGALAQHAAHLRADRRARSRRWDGWRAVDVDADELEDYRDELAERGLAGSTLNQRRAVLSGIFKVARRRFRVGVDPMDGFERAEVKDCRRPRGLLGRGGLGARPRAPHPGGYARPTPGPIFPDRRAVRAAPLGDPRPALARGAASSSARSLCAAATPRSGATGCPRASACTRSRWRPQVYELLARLAPRRPRSRRARVPGREGRRDGRLGALPPLHQGPAARRDPARCASTTCATRSARRRSPPART